jgi:hypothetical protein
MRADSNKTEIENLTVENIPVKNKIEKNIESRIGASRNSIPENLDGDKPQKRKVKAVNNPDNEYTKKM